MTREGYREEVATESRECAELKSAFEKCSRQQCNQCKGPEARPSLTRKGDHKLYFPESHRRTRIS